MKSDDNNLATRRARSPKWLRLDQGRASEISALPLTSTLKLSLLEFYLFWSNSDFSYSTAVKLKFIPDKFELSMTCVNVSFSTNLSFETDVIDSSWATHYYHFAFCASRGGCTLYQHQGPSWMGSTLHICVPSYRLSWPSLPRELHRTAHCVLWY